MKKTLLWVGDAGCETGFARCTHQTLPSFIIRGWDVHVLALNYRGDPHDLHPCKLYPAWVPSSRDGYGVDRLPEIAAKVKPDAIVIQNDPWNFPAYLRQVQRHNVVGAIAVDGLNCKGRDLNGLDLAIFWTQFGLDQARQGGYQGLAAVVGLGVDLQIYKPMPRLEARKLLGLPEKLHDVFIVGNVNRNQPRKRLDLTISYFAQWIRQYSIDDAYLFLHVAPTADAGFDCQQLARYYGIANRLIIAEPEVYNGVGEDMLRATYAAFDIQMSTTQGEGWGLTTMEGMACGVPQIVPDWSALGEWTGDAVVKVACTEIACTPNYINVIGGIADREAMMGALHALYLSEERRGELIIDGLELVKQPQFRWEDVSMRFADEVEGMIDMKGSVIKKEVSVGV